MRKIESLFIGISLIAALSITGSAIWHTTNNSKVNDTYHFPETQFGAFVAAQHAIYVNDFDTAEKLTNELKHTEYTVVNNTKLISEYLSGKLPADAKLLREEKTLPAKFIYEAWLVQNDKWQEMHNRHKKDDSALIAPFRIWPAIANNWRTNTFKYIDSLPVNDSWREFVRGQIYAELGDIDTAAKHFDLVNTDFMNINDYMYLMSFYTHHNMQDRAGELKSKYTTRPAGMFLIDYDTYPDWSVYSGYKNAMAFSLIQNVSHTQILMYSDLAMLMLRFAQIIAPEMSDNTDALNYYLGQFLYTNTGDYNKYFSKISEKSPFYPFVALRNAEKTDDIETMEKALKQFPLFVPVINKTIGYYIKTGNMRAALRVINRALKNKNLDDAGRAFFTKSRAQIYYSFGDYDSAQADIKFASKHLKVDAEIVSLQAKIWAKQNREIEEAYKYAMTLVAKNPSDIMAWDTLGVVVAAREGTYAALDVLERVGEISQTHSPLYVHLGDIYESIGDYDKARQSYMRAIDLSDDGLTVIPEIERKIRKLK